MISNDGCIKLITLKKLGILFILHLTINYSIWYCWCHAIWWCILTVILQCFIEPKSFQKTFLHIWWWHLTRVCTIFLLVCSWQISHRHTKYNVYSYDYGICDEKRTCNFTLDLLFIMLIWASYSSFAAWETTCSLHVTTPLMS